MVYRFILISDEVDDFMREIKIDSDSTFLDFHQTILKTCNYTDDQMTSFTICEDGWVKGQEITLEDMCTSAEEDSYIMAKTRLCDFLDEEKQHLLYTFDPLADRVFFIELCEIKTGKSLDKPVVSRKQGEAPKQVLDFDELFSRNPVQVPATDAMLDDDVNMFGDGISDEDIDLEGLDISDGEPY
jgi:hypothetical protein